MNYSQQELSLIWLDSFNDLAYKHKLEIYNLICNKKDIKSVISASSDYLSSLVGESTLSSILASSNKEYLSYLIDGLESRSVRAITLQSSNYPESLKNLEFPPLVLYTMGNLGLLDSDCFAVVGSRKSLPLQKNLAQTFSKELMEKGFTLITGIAEGIDQTVLETAVSKGVPVISVVAGGFDNIYPKTNLQLFNQVVESGLVISEQPPEVSPKPFMFPIRNRIIAGLSNGVLVVSAGKKSGTLWTASYTEELSKQVFAIPYSPGISSGEGCNELIKKGALLVDNVQDVLEIYGKNQEKTSVLLTEEERQIISLLREGQMHVEIICKKLNKKIFEITPILSIMEINGLVYKNGSNVYGTNTHLEDICN